MFDVEPCKLCKEAADERRSRHKNLEESSGKEHKHATFDDNVYIHWFIPEDDDDEDTNDSEEERHSPPPSMRRVRRRPKPILKHRQNCIVIVHDLN